MKRGIALGVLLGVGASLVLAAGAWAHARVSPPIVKSRESQVFTLAVPTEKDGIFTTGIELTPPKGFSIDSFLPAPGWARTVQQTGSGEDAAITKVTWTGGHVPTGEDAAFEFLGSTDSSKDYSFDVRQTYSDGSVVDWSGPESSDTPAPLVQARSSLAGGGSSLLGIIALVVALVAVVIAVAGLVGGSGKGGRALA
jgi:uncharacterized protein YcnI